MVTMVIIPEVFNIFSYNFLLLVDVRHIIILLLYLRTLCIVYHNTSRHVQIIRLKTVYYIRLRVHLFMVDNFFYYFIRYPPREKRLIRNNMIFFLQSVFFSFYSYGVATVAVTITKAAAVRHKRGRNLAETSLRRSPSIGGAYCVDVKRPTTTTPIGQS